MQVKVALVLLVCFACINGQLVARRLPGQNLQPVLPVLYPQTTTPLPYVPDIPYPQTTTPPPYIPDIPYPQTTTPPPYVPDTPYPTEIYPYDPYEPYDPYDPYPFYFCELNEDEYSRPYFGPYDEFRPSYRPSPIQYPPSRISPSSYYVQPLITRTLPPAESYKIDYKRIGRQALTLPSCIINNECDLRRVRCSGYGTQYDKCGRRCTCRNGYLVDCCRVRKEWRSMTQVERCRHIEVFLIASTKVPWKSCYEELIKVHRDEFQSGIHNMNFFLPWHRWYILALENLLRQIDCRITVPYWDWSLEPLTWQNSIVWATRCGFGGNGVGAGRIVTTGPFRGTVWQLTPSANGGSLRRNFNGRVPDCASIATGQRLGVGEFNSWHPFISSTLHDAVHCRIGGTMCSGDSANAPEFFLHHGFIDKLWEDWQNKGPQFKNLPFYVNNNSPMPGAYGNSPQTTYDLNNQPGCVKVCIEPSSRPCRLNTTYTPTCPRDMSCNEYSPLKLAEIIPRPYPRVPEEAYELFNTPYKIRRISNRYHQLFDDYNELHNVLLSNGYGGQRGSDRPQNGEVQFNRYLNEATTISPNAT